MCFPTETVYALAVDSLQYCAVEKLYQLKRRDLNKKFAIFLPNLESVERLALLNIKQLNFLSKFTPGPLTFIVNMRKNVVIPFQSEKIAIRIPNHPVAQKILEKIKRPLVATSTNFSFEKEAVCYLDIKDEMLQSISSIYCQDEGVSGVVSTIIDISTKNLHIIREGAIKSKTLAQQWDSIFK